MTKPLHLRRLRAAMALKDLGLHWVARQSGVPYTTASEILNGRRVSPISLLKLRRAISAAPMPEEVTE